MSNFALAIEKLLLCYGVLLGYGVMVTLQILVLSFLVRVRVSQLSSSKEQHLYFEHWDMV